MKMIDEQIIWDRKWKVRKAKETTDLKKINKKKKQNVCKYLIGFIKFVMMIYLNVCVDLHLFLTCTILTRQHNTKVIS